MNLTRMTTINLTGRNFESRHPTNCWSLSNQNGRLINSHIEIHERFVNFRHSFDRDFCIRFCYCKEVLRCRNIVANRFSNDSIVAILDNYRFPNILYIIVQEKMSTNLRGGLGNKRIFQLYIFSNKNCCMRNFSPVNKTWIFQNLKMLCLQKYCLHSFKFLKKYRKKN